jgi:hypothetical protein
VEPIELTGEKFGKLSVVERCGHIGKSAMWKCVCDCGKIIVVSEARLNNGKAVDCGCYRHTTHGMTDTRLYRIWINMKTRCHNPKTVNFNRYGGRGIEICDEWDDFQAFYDWAITNGYAKNLTIDRRDNNKGYSPDNCRWVTAHIQQNNKSNNRRIEYKGQTNTVAQWEDIFGMRKGFLGQRLRHGMPFEIAVSKPKKLRSRLK